MLTLFIVDTAVNGTQQLLENSSQSSGVVEAIQIAKDDDPDEDDLVNNPYILSREKAVGPCSFVDFRQPYLQTAPPPKYFDEKILLAPLPSSKEEILRGLAEMEFGGLLCTDEEAMERQKGVLVDVVKQLAITLLKGLTIAHISLPIKIFEPRSSI
jgi:hypothetical protein